MKKYIIILIITSFFTEIGIGQDYEIRTRNAGDGIIAVDLRKTTDPGLVTEVFVTDIVFGIKWDEDYGVSLAEVDNSTAYNIQKSGSQLTKNGFSFQAFYANNTPYNLPSDWPQNEWMEIMTIENTQEGNGAGTFEITEDGFDITTDPNLGVNLEDFSPIINGSASGVSLPIELVNFVIKGKDNKAYLTWETNIEINSDFFEIQKSRDRSSWTNITTVEAQGNSNSIVYYTYTDDNMHVANNGSENNVYYRLRMVDQDGSFTYSPLRSIRTSGNSLVEFTLYPNPTQGSITIESSIANIDSGLIQVYNMNGQLIHEQSLNSFSTKLDLSKLVEGNYILKVENDIEVQTFIVQKI